VEFAMNFGKKIVFLFSVFTLIGTGFVFSQDKIFEQIEKGLEKPKSQEKKTPYITDLFSSITQKKNYTAYKELYLSGRASCDLGKTEGRNSVGFLLYGTFPGSEGQLGDLNVQGRATYYNDQFAHGQMMPREYTRRENQLKLELHNAYLRMRACPPLVNVRVGHFYVPYGLQPWIDTHGTLLQGPTMEFIGMERDWGVSIDGQNDLVEYQAGLTRGSGMEYFERCDNFAFAGKLSTPRIGEHANEWLGISYLIGRIYDPMAVERLAHMGIRDNIVSRWRVGVDGQKIIGPARVRFEISGGKDAKKERLLGEFFELQYVLDSKSRVYSYFQLENLMQNWKRSDTTLRLGLTYVLSANYNLQFVVSKDVRTMWGRKDTWVGVLLYGQLGVK
jgi:hypothetical protein